MTRCSSGKSSASKSPFPLNQRSSMSQPLGQLWQPSDLRDLRPQLELLLPFCDTTQLSGAGLSLADVERLLSPGSHWSDTVLQQVLAATELPVPYGLA